MFHLELPHRDAGEVAPNDAEQTIHPIVLYGIQTLIGVAGGQEYLTPRRRILPLLSKLMSGAAKRINIGGAVVERIGSQVRFYREMRNLSPLVVDSGDAAIWDGRLHLYNETASTVFVEAAKRSQILELEKLRGVPFEIKPRQALWSTPLIHCHVDKAGQSAIMPLIDPSGLPAGLHVRLASPAIEHFCPEFDEALRDWVISLDRFSAASIAPKS